VQAYASEAAREAFAASYARVDTVVEWLCGPQAAQMTHAQLEDRLHTDGLAVLRQLLQDSLDLRAEREQRLVDVTDADGVARSGAEYGHERDLATVFGQVRVARIAYRSRGRANLHPADAALNLPAEKHSHGLRRLAAIEATRGSFDAAAAGIERATGVRVGKRQVEELTVRAAIDVDAFYTARDPGRAADTDVLGLTADAKGIVMRPDALREPTAKAAVSRKLTTRLSRGEKRFRKRMAEVGAVCDITPVPRTVADILPPPDAPRGSARPAPRTRTTWLHASVSTDAAAVITAMFDEATRRDPEHRRTWVALVDGNRHQIDRIRVESRAHKVSVPIVVDFVHVLEYVWAAAWCFFAEGDRAAETWVREHARRILHGQAGIVAAAIRRTATNRDLSPEQRRNADRCATYLLNNKRHLDYPTALARGWPIATGVIEGACRYLVKDRMDITGARWGLPGAEAILKLRALISNGDFDAYWTFHLTHEQQRVHNTRYLDGVIPGL
jgi:hypothetical protein